MPWYNVAACFLGGMFLANFFPHFIAGMSGARFYTPFAKPPFRGLSRPAVNVFYGLLNLVVAYALLVTVGGFELGGSAAQPSRARASACGRSSRPTASRSCCPTRRNGRSPALSPTISSPSRSTNRNVLPNWKGRPGRP